MTRRAAKQVYEAAGIGPEDINVVELHDCFTPNEVISYEGLGLCGEGEAEKFIHDGNNTYGGKYVMNPSGGLMSKGHPLGATGLAQCTELVCAHLRGQAGDRQMRGSTYRSTAQRWSWRCLRRNDVPCRITTHLERIHYKCCLASKITPQNSIHSVSWLGTF